MTETPDLEPRESRKKPSLLDQYLPSSTSKLIAALVIVAIVGVAGFFIYSATAGKAAATVNGEKILLSQINSEYSAYVSQYTAANKQKPNKQMEQSIKRLILERLIREKLIKQAAEKEGIKVSDKDIDKGVEQIKSSTSKEALEKGLKQMGWTMDDLRNRIADQLLQTKIREKETKGIEIKDEEVKKYYDQNKKNYYVPEQAKVKIAKFDSQDKAHKFLADVNGGKDFDAAAKTHVKGGVQSQSLGKDQITGIYGKAVTDAVWKLSNGQVSDDVKGQSGYYVAKLESKSAGKQKTFNEVKQEVKGMLTSQKQQEKFNTWLEDVRKKATIKVLVKELEQASNNTVTPQSKTSTKKK
ncbi:MAG: hypothetical protein C4562_05820 [Actinobacteria bacterium]|nr:MAG: hypothetical protein C4562_05820 [Actinomycetota bacterium]